ncbi:Type II/IV secretion system secretin RcpA/CpaC associated with Flp pilus assembly [Paramagnetospirillum magnetotacticum MS-1]|uniref:Type II/IV secretion system secretin RcpA/CpaC associated with Flp pilus assembly n=1 Tax=Paramagnetospirillum magnetotacticum MS-1 TaxID=272627 RepID=A0A0C2V3R5_PARME|nr:type II and III secretion system protein family protein [Paramagnetospirillum magnetotacticum]KIL99706.1 Type II/IV secretion system secretin RcpA/CpaC associated with Flp pilus assembly [Paramagnetospirillum magnetotacticum MS-1]
MRGRFIPAAILAILLAMPAWAQSEEPPPPHSAPRAMVITLGAPSGPGQAQRAGTPRSLLGATAASAESMQVPVGKSVDLTLPGAVREVVIGNSDIADVMVRSPNLVHITGRAVGQTNVFLVDRAGRVMRRIDLNVSIDSQAVRDALRAVLPDERAINVEAVADSLYLSGSVKNDAAARDAKMLARRFVAEDAKLVNLLRVVNEQQVLLHVKVAEIQRTVLKELGFGLTANKGIPLIGSSVLGSGSKTSSTVGLIDSSSTAIFGTATITGIGALAANLNILENQGLIRTLVEPNLTAVSGETATMLAGGELPIPISQTNGAVSVEFKPYGVLLSFTPTVLDPGRLSLKMSTEVSAIDNNNKTAISSSISVPAFKVRRAGSTVELPSGGSIMIAGLLQNDITSNITGLPGLMDLPVLGLLFRSNAFQRNETELVVILSAYVVRPVEQPVLGTPNDGFAPSSDLKRFLLGRLQDTYTKRSRELPATPPSLQGPYGHIVQ